MKAILFFVAIVGFACADDVSDARAFIKCLDKSLNDGLPSVPIPSHNPLSIRNLTYSGTYESVSYTIGLTDNWLYDLLNYTFPVLNATSYSNPERAVYYYDLYWPLLNFTGNWVIDIDTTLIDTHWSGTYTILMYEIDWWGIFDLTKPGQEAQGYNETLNAFTLESSTETVTVDITGVEIGSGAIETAIKEAVYYGMNNVPAILAEMIRTARFNDYWIDNPERIHEILKYCGLE